MGFDPPEENLAWAEREGFQYELWTDDTRMLALTYGAIDEVSDTFPSRVTMVLDAEGTLVLEYRDSLNVGTHPADVLADCTRLFGP